MNLGVDVWWWEGSLWRYCWAWCGVEYYGNELTRRDMTRLGSTNGKGQISRRITYFPRTKGTEKAKSDGEQLVNNST